MSWLVKTFLTLSTFVGFLTSESLACFQIWWTVKTFLTLGTFERLVMMSLALQEHLKASCCYFACLVPHCFTNFSLFFCQWKLMTTETTVTWTSRIWRFSDMTWQPIQKPTLTIVNRGEWLWNSAKFFVVCFCSVFWPWPCTKHNSCLLQTEELTNRNVLVT